MWFYERTLYGDFFVKRNFSRSCVPRFPEGPGSRKPRDISLESQRDWFSYGTHISYRKLFVIYGTFAGVEVMSELRCNADLPIVIRSSFGRVPAFF